MFWITPPKKWASLIGEYAPLMVLYVLRGQVYAYAVVPAPVLPLRFTDFTMELFIVQVVPDWVTSRYGCRPPEPYSYWPVFWLPPGPVPTSALVRPSHCLRTRPLLASTMTNGRVGMPPRSVSAKNDTTYAMCARPLSSTKTIWSAFSFSVRMKPTRLPRLALLASARALPRVSFGATAGSSPARPLTMRPNISRTEPSLRSVTTTCSPHTGTPRKVCW